MDNVELDKLLSIVEEALSEDNEVKIMKYLNKKLPEMGLNVRLRRKEVEQAVESFEDSEYGKTFVGADNLIYLILKKAGYNVIKNGRSVLLIQECEKPSVRLNNKPLKGVCITVIGDPDCGIIDFDEVFIKGYRFGLDALIVNDEPYIDTHLLFGGEVETLLRRLKFTISGYKVKYVNESVEKYLFREKIVNMIIDLINTISDLYKYLKKKS